jgi:chorismate lyase/3-hydroxybenzoate synthase
VTRLHDHLQIVLSNSISPPTDDHSLLVAFRFGPISEAEDHPAIANTYLHPVDHECLYECWWIAEPVTYRRIGSTRIVECSHYTVAIQDNHENSTDHLESLTARAYSEIIDAVQSTKHERIAKVWNYLGGINDGDGDLERYRRFSAGRATAFAEKNIPDSLAPSGTGIGTIQDLGLTIVAIASKHPLELAENPRQISAFTYPQQYGPSSPKFARIGYVTNEKHTLCLVSGTAAIVGHESLHPNEVASQVDETLLNLAALSETGSVLDASSVSRVYLRNPGDVELVRQKLEGQLGLRADRTAFLHGNICRRELVIEIDGVRVQ